VITTIVLIRAEPSSLPKTAQRLAEIDGVTDVYSVSGDWDLVAIVKVPEYDQIAHVVTEVFPDRARAAAHADAHGVPRVLQEGSSAGLGHRGRLTRTRRCPRDQRFSFGSVHQVDSPRAISRHLPSV
jgi:DNA-binding Lrp family transcriptional regulator